MSGRSLGTMITYGYPGHRPRCRARPGRPARRRRPGDPAGMEPVSRSRRWSVGSAADRGLSIHSAHGCWGGRTIRAARVDLGSTDPAIHRESVDDLKRCVDWLGRRGRDLPGGPSRRPVRSRPTGPIGARRWRGACSSWPSTPAGASRPICVENMPPGVYPGSRMAELAELLRELDHPGWPWPSIPATPTSAPASRRRPSRPVALLATTHVHDNNGRQDSHEPPGQGTIDWPAWGVALDRDRLPRPDHAGVHPGASDTIRVPLSTGRARRGSLGTPEAMPSRADSSSRAGCADHPGGAWTMQCRGTGLAGDRPGRSTYRYPAGSEGFRQARQADAATRFARGGIADRVTQAQPA